MARKRQYPSDLKDKQWEEIRQLIPPAKDGGRPRDTEVRSVIDAIFYLNKNGCGWRALPCDFPPWQTVYTYFKEWRLSETWKKNQRRIEETFEKKRRKGLPIYGWLHRLTECKNVFCRGNQGIRWWKENKWPEAPHISGQLGPSHGGRCTCG